MLTFKNVKIYQGRYPVLEEVNLHISQGELVYLVGPVGSGKTSLMKTIYGELDCEGEEARVLEFNLLKLKPRHWPSLRREMGIVYQNFQLLQDHTAYENLDFVLRATDWSKKEAREERIKEVLDRIGLNHKAQDFVYKFSGGEQQRLCIARAILNRPRLILADEPTGNLDEENGEKVMSLLYEIRAKYNTSVLVSTHNMQWIQKYPGTVYRCENNGLMPI